MKTVDTILLIVLLLALCCGFCDGITAPHSFSTTVQSLWSKLRHSSSNPLQKLSTTPVYYLVNPQGYAYVQNDGQVKILEFLPLLFD